MYFFTYLEQIHISTTSTAEVNPVREHTETKPEQQQNVCIDLIKLILLDEFNAPFQEHPSPTGIKLALVCNNILWNYHSDLNGFKTKPVFKQMGFHLKIGTRHKNFSSGPSIKDILSPQTRYQKEMKTTRKHLHSQHPHSWAENGRITSTIFSLQMILHRASWEAAESRAFRNPSA